jgi:hypothetical protein
MKIHKVLVRGSNQTVCGVNRPKNTTVDAPLVTCKKCLKEELRWQDELDFVFPIKGLRPYTINQM